MFGKFLRWYTLECKLFSAHLPNVISCVIKSVFVNRDSGFFVFMVFFYEDPTLFFSCGSLMSRQKTTVATFWDILSDKPIVPTGPRGKLLPSGPRSNELTRGPPELVQHFLL